MRRAILLLAAVMAACAAPAGAEAGKTWTTGGAEQLAQGKLEGVSVLSTGRVELAPVAEQLEGPETEFVWDVEADTGVAGAAVYVATGAPAGLYRLGEGGLRELHKRQKAHALSVLPLPDGSVLAGIAPMGLILRIDRHGDVEDFARLEDHYVWDMALGPDHKIYCATGPAGRLLRLDRAGEIEELLKVKQRNLMCVAVAPDGTVYAGTDTDGYVYAVSRDGTASVLYDADEGEVHDLAVDADGVVYACTAQAEPAGPPQGPPGPQGGGPPQQASPPPPPRPGGGQPSARNSVYRITPGEGAVRIGQFERAFLLSLALSGDRVLVGSGGEQARLIAIDPDMDYRILAEFEAAYVMGMAPSGDAELILATSKPGGLWRIEEGFRKEGTFLSEPFDAGYLSRWGRLWWTELLETGQGIRLRLRTGNSAEPDEHWSPWSEWVHQASGGKLDVAMGRFAQFAAELSTRGNVGTPQLVEVNVSYRQANRRPVIHDMAVDGQSLLRGGGNDEQQRGRPAPRGRPSPPQPNGGGQAPGQTVIAWKASDPNDDPLTFDLYYRGVDEADWKALKEDMEGESSYRWDTSRVPDGRYTLKLVARDDAARPPQEALFDARVSPAVLIDNRPPAVRELAAEPQDDGSYTLSGVAADDYSPIAAVEVSVNSGHWRPVFPDDGIFDAPEEPFTFRTDVLEPGEYVLVFAATDAGGNVGSARIVITVPAPPQ